MVKAQHVFKDVCDRCPDAAFAELRELEEEYLEKGAQSTIFVDLRTKNFASQQNRLILDE